GFRGEGTVPRLTDEVRTEAARRYIEAYEIITGQRFKAVPEEKGDIQERIRKNLKKYF
ncbi:phosphoribosylaminoimidazolesuccinocarboxamide synthase, partial [Candidatus Woesearchaeota archaeon CG_4_10_14_0_8_um_filter_47_5]